METIKAGLLTPTRVFEIPGTARTLSGILFNAYLAILSVRGTIGRAIAGVFGLVPLFSMYLMLEQQQPGRIYGMALAWLYQRLRGGGSSAGCLVGTQAAGDRV